MTVCRAIETCTRRNIPSFIMKSTLTTLFASALLALPATAHYLWIEAGTPDQARVNYGEFNEGVLEKAGARLDERDGIEGWFTNPDSTKTPLKFEKQPDHFSAKLPTESGWILAQDLKGVVMDWTQYGIGVVKPMFYARAAAAGTVQQAASPALTLDIVPVAGKPLTYQVFFQGKPLPNAKGFTYAPNQWMQEFATDADGKFTIVTPWTGRYVLELIHLEKAPGEFQDVAYEALRHRVTFSFLR